MGCVGAADQPVLRPGPDSRGEALGRCLGHSGKCGQAVRKPSGEARENAGAVFPSYAPDEHPLFPGAVPAGHC